MSTTVKKNSINVTELRRALSTVVSKSARDFKLTTRRRMEESIPQGATYERSRGRGFATRHRASARGQRPAKLTGTLINAVDSRKTGDFSGVVDIRHLRNPENGEYADEYAEKLQEEMDRPIISDSDTRIAEIKFNYECQAAVDRLIK